MERLSLIHCAEIAKIVPMRRSLGLNLDNQIGFRLTGIAVIRPAQNFTFEENRLQKAILDNNLGLQITTLDPDGIIRSQTFQCETDTAVGLRYTSSRGDTTITFEFDHNARQKTHLLLVK